MRTFSIFLVMVFMQLCFLASSQEDIGKFVEVLKRILKFRSKYCNKEVTLTQEQLRNIEACHENSLLPNTRETCKKVVFGTRMSKDLKQVREGLCWSAPTFRFYRNCLKDIIF